MGKKTKALVIFFVSFLILSLLSEFVLRLKGVKPFTPIRNAGFHKVDSLWSYETFITDDSGIFKFNPAYFSRVFSQSIHAQDMYSISEMDEITKYIYFSYNPVFANNDSLSDALFPFLKDIRQANERANCNSSLFRYTVADSETIHLSGIAQYHRLPINADGFRSIPFQAHEPHKKSILLIGDSYTFGLLSYPIISSFYDYLLSKGFVVYNAGIPGADLAQYKAIAQTYIPRLKPDLVIMLFDLCGQNDVMPFDRVPSKKHPLLYYTNAGMLNGYTDDGVPFINANESYQASLIHCYGRIGQYLPSSLARSIIFSRLIHAIDILIENRNKKGSVFNSGDMTRKRLKDVQEICKENKSQFLISVIPDLNGSVSFDSNTRSIFKDFNTYYPSVIDSNDYPHTFFSAHFLASGHRKYGIFLKQVIDSVFNETP